MADLNDIYEVKLFSRGSTNYPNPVVAVNVLHYIVTTKVGTTVNDQDIADRMFAVFTPGMTDVFTPAETFNFASVQRIFPLPKLVTEFSLAAPVPGTQVLTPPNEPMPPQVCGIITKFTALAGRRNRGRFYIPFPYESFNTLGAPTAGYLTAVGALRTQLVAIVTVTSGVDMLSLAPVLFHRVGVPNFNPLTATATRQYWVTQRRRATFRGPDGLPIPA